MPSFRSSSRLPIVQFVARALLLVVGCCCLASAQTQYPILDPFKATVKVRVSGSEQLKPEISSYLTRELRSVPSIEITDSLYDYEVSLVAMTVRDIGGHERGVTIAYLVTRVLHAEKALGLRANIAPSMLEVFDTLYRETHTIEKFGLLTGSSEDLQSLCRRLVAEIDSDLIEPARRSTESIQRQVREGLRKATAPQTKERA